MSNGNGQNSFAMWLKFSWPILTVIAGCMFWVITSVTRLETVVNRGVPPPEVTQQLEQIERRLGSVEEELSAQGKNVAVILSKILEDG